jgi:hypothetical protein
MLPELLKKIEQLTDQLEAGERRAKEREKYLDGQRGIMAADMGQVLECTRGLVLGLEKVCAIFEQ